MYTVKAHPGYVIVYKEGTRAELILPSDPHGVIHTDALDRLTGEWANLPEYTRQRIEEAAQEAQRR